MVEGIADEDAFRNRDGLLNKGRRTRQQLLVAAHAVFEEDGFLDSRVADIAARALVSHGTFYTYFDSKADIFRAVLTEFLPPIYTSNDYGSNKNPSPYERIEFGNRRFFEVYRKHATMLGLFEQAATFDPQVKVLRTKLRHTAERRIRYGIGRMQEQGIVAGDLDAEVAASCLVAMVTHSYYTWLVMEDRNFDLDEAVTTLSRLWASALGIHTGPAKRTERPLAATRGKRRRH